MSDNNGQFEITTSAGTTLIYEVRDTSMHVTRKPGMSRPTGGSEPARQPGDFTPLLLGEPLTPVVGEPLSYRVEVEGRAHHFTTAPVTGILEKR